MNKFSLLSIFYLIAGQDFVKLEDGSVIEVQPGGQVLGTLDSNPSTGYQWVFHYAPSDTFLVTDLGYTHYADKALAGSGGFQSFRFEAEDTCQRNESLDVIFEYKRGWESYSIETLIATIIC